jgi:putative transposase
MTPVRQGPAHERWALFRFSVVGPLLSSPPSPGELATELAALAATTWQHPIRHEPVCFGLKTIESWYYAAKNAAEPITALRPKVRRTLGQHPSLGPGLGEALRAQYAAHPSWTYKLHYDNVLVRAEAEPALGPVPGYATLRRFLKDQGLLKQPRARSPRSPGEAAARARKAAAEVRSYEVEYVGALWHLDFHHGSRKVLVESGAYVTPLLFGVLDDRSRLCCHLQWYLEEGARELVHGLSQAFLKRGLPRALLTDNGGAMLAAETTQGLARLSILHETTLPNSAYQNGKQESFWGQIEGRLLPMLESKKDLTLPLLNQATQAWVEGEYNRALHREMGAAPLARFLEDRSVLRPSPTAEALREAFRQQATRTQRRSDGTVSIEGVRFEVPSRFGHLERLCVRYARWDKTHASLVDERRGEMLGTLYPVDKARNAEGHRGPRQHPGAPVERREAADEVAPLLTKLMADYARTGLPAAYLPLGESPPEDGR